MNEWFEISRVDKPARPAPQRVITTHEWQGIPAGRRGEFVSQAGDRVRIRLDQPIYRMGNRDMWTFYIVSVYVLCVRPLTPLEQLAECSK